MPDAWTSYELAEELLKLFPNFGRLVALYVHSTDEGETTLMQVSTLFFLIENPASVSELAKKRKVSLQAASAQVQGLVERGWVLRIPDSSDRRRSLLEVTPEGFATARAAKDQIANHLAGFLDDLSLEERIAAQVFLPGLWRVVQQQMRVDATEGSDSS